MKYLWIFVAVVILVRIDMVLKFFDSTSEKIQSSSAPELKSGEVGAPGEVVSIESDLSLKSSPRKKFLSMLEDFHMSSDQAIKEKIIESLKANPQILSEKLDADFEAAIYRWRDLVMQKNKTCYELVLELMRVSRGENQDMLKRFFSIVIDNDLPEFLQIYSKSPDINCMIMTNLADPLPEEEKFNELNQRLQELDAYMASEKFNPLLKAYADRCQMVLKLQVEKMRQFLDGVEAAEASAPEESATPVISAPAPETTPVPGSNP